jgi:hypothetical protein
MTFGNRFSEYRSSSKKRMNLNCGLDPRTSTRYVFGTSVDVAFIITSTHNTLVCTEEAARKSFGSTRTSLVSVWQVGKILLLLLRHQLCPARLLSEIG